MPKNKRLHFKDIAAIKAIVFVPIYLYCILQLISLSKQSTLIDITPMVEKIARSSFDFFFFLSSFLLISHGLREYKYLDQFSIRNFFIRRVLRIGVVLILGLIFAFVIHPWLNVKLDLQPINLPSIKYYLLGVPNYLSTTGGDQLIYLKVICSIYLFIQLYVYLGIILRYFRNQLILIGTLTVMIGLLARGFHLWNDTDYFLDTLSYGIPVGIGIMTAVSVRKENWIFQRIKETPKRIVPIIYSIGSLLFLVGYMFTFNTNSVLFVPILTGLFFGFVVIEQTFGKHSFVQLKTKKILSYLGKLTYGMIVYQAIIGVLMIIAMQSLDINLNSFYMIGLIIIGCYVSSIVVADLSYKLLEKPILRIRREFKKV